MPLSSFAELEKTGRMPSPTGLAMEILRLTQQEDCALSDIAEVLSGDPALTGRILQLSNSVLSGARHPVVTVHDATVRLGMRSIRQVALGFSLISSEREGACEAFDYDRYWAECLARAVLMQALSSRFRIGVPAEAFVLGLLSDVGSLALATVHPGAYSTLLQESTSPGELRRRELEHFGIDRDEVTRCLLDRWGLVPLRDTLASAKDAPPDDFSGPLRLVDLLRVAGCFARAFRDGASRPDPPEVVESVLSRDARWSPAELADLWERAGAEWRRWGRLLEIETPELPGYGSAQPARAVAATEGEVPGPVDPLPELDVETLESLTVLAVDDDPVALRLVSHHLRAEGHEVLTASDGEEGLRLALARNPHIVVADWQMPNLDGLQLCRSLREYEAGRQMYFILLTGNQNEDQIIEAFHQGVDDYITKPFRPRILVARVGAARRVIQLQRQVAVDRQAMQEQVSQLGVLNRKLEESSRTDPLTQLPNRRAAMQDLHRAWEYASRHGNGLSAVMIDIDHFKKFNDRYGHDIGDKVLIQTAASLSAGLRSSDSVYRMGGEEFLALLPHGEEGSAETCAERLRACIERQSLHVQGQRLHITASIGLADKHPGMDSTADLLKAADLALYEAKDQGRNRVVVARANRPSRSPKS